jgi:hypothetical protein
MSRRAEITMSGDEIRELLAEARTAILTTLGPDGWPHSAAMWFVPRFDGAPNHVHMWTYRKSQKAANAFRDDRCAFLIETGVEYHELRGVLVQDRLEIVTDFEPVYEIGKEIYRRYVLPRTGVPLEEGPEVEVERQARKRVGLVLSLGRVASWDHRKLGSS